MLTDRQSHRKNSAAAVRIRSSQPAAVLRDDAMGQRETHSMSRRFCSEEGNEDALKICGRNAHARVPDFNPSPPLAGFVALRRTVNGNPPIYLTLGNRLGRVANQIQ